MNRELISPMQLHSTMRAGREAHVASVCGGGELDHVVDWRALRAGEGEGGNPCLGIAVGCVLSLPIWVGLAIVSYLIR
jgi:hypothetical protein